MNFITRAQWGARPPTTPPVIVPWAQRIGVAYHIQDGNRNTTPAGLQNYAMDTLGYSDSHYNLSTKVGYVYEMRGITVKAAHAATQLANHNVPWIGVVVFGRNADVTDLDLKTLGEIHKYIEAQAGKPLLFSGHGQLYGSQTNCPDTKIRNWLTAGGPNQGDNNMGVWDEIIGSQDVAENVLGPAWDNPGQPAREWLKWTPQAAVLAKKAFEKLEEQETAIAELKEAIDGLGEGTYPGTPAEFEEMHERVMRRILASVPLTP